jgi:hypothetical protein
MIPRHLCAAIAIVALHGSSSRADEGGVSYRTPGQYGSFAAIAPSPGWSLPLVFYNYGGSVGAQQPLTRGNLLTAGLRGSLDGLFIVPTYTRNTTILGAVPSFSMGEMPAYSAASANLGLGPLSRSRSDSIWGGSDLYPTAQLFWNKGGVNNFMAYLTGDIPVGSYNPDRLANIGIGHGAIDGGGAYTTSTQRPEPSSPQPSASLEISPTLRRTIPTGSTRISIWQHRNSSTSSFSSARSPTSISN